jgi:hypothetical protein
MVMYMTRRRSRVLLVLAIVVGLGSLVLALLEPSSIGSWATLIGMVCVAWAQVMYLQNGPDGRR